MGKPIMRPPRKCRNARESSKARQRGCIGRMEEEKAGVVPLSTSEQ